MKKRLLLLILSVLTLMVSGKPFFSPDKTYHIEVEQFRGGCVADGVSVGQQTPLFYLSSATTASETYWLITEESEGLYSFRNAKTGQYITYDGVRSDYRRYVTMTTALDGNKSLWTITLQSDNLYVIRNASATDQVWDVRRDSYMVGTYSRQNDISSIERFAFYDNSGAPVKEVFSTTATPLDKALSDLHIDHQGLAYAASTAIYLCPIPLDCFGNDYTATIDYGKKEGWNNLTIDGTAVETGSQHTFAKISAGKTYTLSVKQDNGTSISAKLTFTSLPVVKMYGSFSDTYAEGHIMVMEPGKPQAAWLNMKAKWRGGITNNDDKHKRNYHVKLQDENGEKMDAKFFGLRNDNSWILEACQVDMSRVRNRVVTDLWNDYSIEPYYFSQEPKAMTGTRGHFVEMILNDEYRGIYCMTEFIDRKQMKLKKYDEENNVTHGQLWKSKDWSYAVFMGHNSNSTYYPRTSPVSFNNNKESWDQYYVKYPDFEDYGNKTDWTVLYNAVNFVCTASDATFKQQVADYFDLPLVIDYYILMETILSTDNHGKNMFFACYDKQADKKITFGIWDLDATCGQRWSDNYYHWSGMKPEQDYATYIVNNEHGDYTLFKRLRDTNADDFNMKVRLRYRELRDSHLATNSILERFRTYLNEFKTCGAANREYAKWNGDSDIANRTLNFDTEMDYLADWITRRLNYLDTNRFDIASLPTDINTVVNTPQAIQKVYNLKGQTVGTADHLKQLPAGIYIIGGKKILIP